MDRAKKARTPLRTALTRTIHEVNVELSQDDPDHDILREKLIKLEDLEMKTSEYDTKVLDEMLDADAAEDVYGAEHRAIEEYQDRIRVVKMKINKVLNANVDPAEPARSVVSVSTNGEKRRTYKLPTIEMKKFTGDLKEWLGWWAQFQKIHIDDELHPTDKFQYLLQATVEGSRARRLVDGYPQTAENYPKVIEALIDRYGDKVLLTELYVRQLARLVVMNASKNNSRSLSNMFDELESSLRALESLGVTAEQSAAFLYPLVESSLPEDIQKVWQRSTLAGYDEEGKDKAVDERLKSLMKFLKMEVKGAERLTFVNAGIGNSQQDRRRDRREPKSREEYPTATGLHSAEVRKCLFCDKGHESKDCGKASTMSYEEKRNKMDQRKCCFACLRTGHGVKKCKTFVRCQICSKRHYVVVCPELASIRSSPQKSFQSNGESSNKEEVKDLTAATSHGTVLLQTLRVKLHGPHGTKVVRGLIDSGAQRSYILNSTAIELGLPSTGTQQLAHAVFGGQVTERRSHNQHEVRIESVRGSSQLMMSLLGQERICNTLPRIEKGSWLNQLKKEGVFLTDLQPGAIEIEVLFGADACPHLFTGIIKKIQESIIAVETKLGWTVMGRIENMEESVSCLVINSCLDVAEIERLWSLDTLGIKDPAERLSNQEEEAEARNHFLQTVSRAEDGRYIVGLPWIDKQKRIPDNRAIAEKRLQSATNKLRIADKYQVYEQIFLDWLREGIIEIANEDTPNCHYLPHRPVFKPESTTTPVRPVFDASCKHGRNPSLNDLLQKGPNLIELIPSVLLRFRRHEVGVVSDIRKAFQMIDVKEEDRDFLRFLWWDSKGQIMKFRHKRVVFGINSSPFLLGAVLQYHLSNVKEGEKETARKLMTSIYVDNCVCSFKTFREYLDFKKASVELLAQAKMELRQWECSAVEDSRVGLLSGSRCGLESGSGTSLIAEKSTTNVLGLCWDKEGDFLSIVLPKETSTSVSTKRELLSSVAKLFDPMGFVCPTTLVPRLLLQQTWIIKLGWDEEIPESVKYQFEQWKNELSSLSLVKIPRFAFDFCDHSDSYELHTFCDASKCSFAAVVFVRTENRGQVSVQLLMAKSRVAPKKASTIPRLELLGCVIGSRLCHSVTEAYGKERVRKFFWTDSTTALAWIRRNDEWGTFVGNRVKQINELTNATEWRHIPGPNNPADLPSRGCSPNQLLKSRWWEGPSWLRDKQEDWPRGTSSEDEDLIVSERRKTKVVMLTSTTSHAWYVTRFSTYMKNIKVMAWIRRFVGRTRRKSNQVGNLTVEEIKNAESQVMKLIQQETFSMKGEVIEGIRVVKNEAGLICVNTKLIHRQDHASFRLPVLLPSRHPIVEQLIRYYHSIWCHSGVQHIMGKLREKFWIMKARSVIKAVIASCVKCRRFSTKSPCIPPAPLPKDRVTCGSAFQVTGVDLAGPLFLRNGTKVWVVLFTCAVYRCVHLEMVGSLSTEAFLLALQKFICRRGRPDVVWSDNGTNFRGAVNGFKLLDWMRIEAETSTKMIKWKFIPPTAAWWGGWWERLIRTIKDMLRKMLGHSKLSWSQLESVLCDVEGAMNERPLTYVSDDQEDLVPLTPSMFLHGPLKSTFPESEVLDAIGMRKAVTSLNVLRAELLSRFRKEYLAHLVHRGKMEKHQKIQVGDVVLVGSDQKKRLFWPMGLVVKLLPGADGNCRVAEVRVRDGILRRPIQRLFPLEISSKSEAFPISIEEMKSKKPPEHPQEQNQVTTRAGRRVKKPKRYGSSS